MQGTQYACVPGSDIAGLILLQFQLRTGNVAAGAMLIKIHDLIVTKGQSGSEVDVTSRVDSAFCDIIGLCNSSFSNSVN